MKEKVLMLLACLWLGIGFSMAQAPKTVAGVVTSADDGEPIIGASVLVEGTTMGVQRGGSGTQHLPQKLRFYQAPQVAPHIVRPDAEEEACLDPMPAQQLQQPRNAVPRAAKGIDIYA